MNGELAIVSVTFASVAAALGAVGFLLRDLFAPAIDAVRQRLEFAPSEPEGDFDKAFFRLLNESGAEFDMATATAMILGAAVVGAAVPVVLFDSLLWGATGAVIGASLPVAYLLVTRFFRIRDMRIRLPNALQAVADAVRSGQSLSEACDLVSQEIKGPLGREFAYAHSQLELGHSPLSVMNRMVQRVPLPEFRIFATAVVVHRRAGGNLSLLTERMSRAAYDKQEVRNHLLAVTAGSRLSAIGMVVGAAVALLILGWIEPDYLESFLKTPKGNWLLATAIGLQIAGGIWVWRILRITA
ncbi:MAG: type II secretion system F family protein [Pirellulaceae bacterium]|nr:type II secretion system F family protein [Pirellulaceae bacterium]